MREAKNPLITRTQHVKSSLKQKSNQNHKAADVQYKNPTPTQRKQHKKNKQ
jgi:hypothetical protein